MEEGDRMTYQASKFGKEKGEEELGGERVIKILVARERASVESSSMRLMGLDSPPRSTRSVLSPTKSFSPSSLI